MNKYFCVHYEKSNHTQLIRNMKLTISLIFLLVCQISAESYAQRINLSASNRPLGEVLTEIRKQSAYNIVVKPGVLEQSIPVSVDLKNSELQSALSLIFEKQSINYTIIDKTIILTSQESVFRNNIIQFNIVKGTIKNQQGEPLVGASIRVVGQHKQAISDERGSFELPQVEGEVTLVISYLGYKTKSIKVKLSETNLTIILEAKEESLDEVSISTGIFKKVDKSFTGSSTTVTAEELKMHGNRNLISSLRNIDPSFVIVENNLTGSNPNQLPDIQIRGSSSLPNVDNLDNLAGLNTPLIILDGFQSSLQRMLDININEVESLTILKDASATAIYGSRGANGVIVITTKLPKEGTLRISYSGQTNIEVADLSGYNLLNAREKLELEKRVGLYNYPSLISADLELKKYYNYLLNEVNSGVNTDWLRVPLHRGIGQRHNLGFSGGSSAFRYSASGQINNIQGVMIGSERKVFNVTINLSYQLKDVKFSNQTIISEGRQSNSPYGTFSEYALMNPYFRAYDTDGTVLKELGYPGGNYYAIRWNTLPTNPMYNASLNGFDKTKRSELINNTSFEWSIIDGLMLRGQLGLSKNIEQGDLFRPADHTAFANYAANDIFRRGDYRYTVNNGLSYDGALNLQYSKLFNEKHLWYSGLDFNIRHQESSLYGFLAEGFTNPKFDFISMALQYAQGQKPYGSESYINTLGITANSNYIYDDRYFTDVSLRFDGSSQFGAKKRIAPFWSFGLGWNIHNERFLKNSSVVDRLKIRGSTGITGSQNFSAYQALSTYRYFNDKRYFTSNGAYLLGLGNENLKWQQTQSYNLGVDAELFNRRLKVVGDLYQSKTKDLVSSISIPASTGFSSYVENIGEMQNQGFEFRATGVMVDQGRNGWYTSVTAGVTQNKNKIVSISSALRDAQKNRQMAEESTPSNLYLEGYSTRTIWVVPSLGIDPSNGREVYLNNDGVPTYDWNGSYLKPMGNLDPDYFGNFSFLAKYKGLTLNATFSYRFGGQDYNQTLINKVENVNYRYNVDRRVYDERWQQPGDKVQFKGLKVTDLTYKTSRFVQDDNTLTCQNIFLQYDVSSSWRKKLKMEQLQLTFNVDQPFRISSIKQERGIAYPFSRLYTVGISTTF